MRAGVGARPVILLGGLLLLLSGCSNSPDKKAARAGARDLPDIPDAVPKVEPKSRYGNPASYVVFGKRYYTKASSDGHVERGLASWYGKKFHGRKTSSGERYDMYGMTAAHKTLPLPSYVQVTNLSNGRSAVVRVNDRGPFHGKRIIDLSYSAARKLGVVARGTAMVEVRSIDPRRPRSIEENSFLASEDGATEASKDVAVARQLPAAKKRTAGTEETAPRVAKAEKPDAKKDEAPIQVVATGESSPSGSKAATAGSAGTSGKAEGSAMYLQVGAFGSRINAEQLRRRLVSHIAEQVKVRTISTEQASWYKVHVGPLDSRETAKDLSQRLASLGLGDSHVVVE